MKESPKQEEHHGVAVWVNPTTELLRKKECLCLNCDKLSKDPTKTNCPAARVLYALCVADNIALMVTRCPDWKELKKKKRK